VTTAISTAEGKERAKDYGTGSDLSNYILGIFEAFISARLPWEQLWEECWYNYLGQYSPATVWRKTEGTGTRSRIFVKVTTLKCNTAHSKIIDVLFQGKGEAPFDLKALDTDLMGIPPEQALDIIAKSKQRLRDHFRDISFEEILDTEILAMAILGTGVLKGPIVELQRKHVVRQRMLGGMPITDIDPEAKGHEVVTVNQIVPVLDGIPLWEYYTDINAKSTKDAIGEIHFQRLLPAHFRQLAYQPGYNKERVIECASRPQSDHPQDKRYIVLGDNYMGTIGAKDERIPALEWWGLTPAKYLRAEGAELPDDVEDDEDVEALTVLSADGIVCKATLNPLGWRPFYVCPYKQRPHVIYGMGVSEMMRDSQKMVNSATRIYIDNKALSGNAMVAINKDRIDTKRTTNLEVYPGKSWWTKGNFSPKEAIDSVKIEDVTHGIREMIEMFMRFSDEETGIPKYTSGESDTFLNKMLDINTPVPMADGSFKTLEHIIDGDMVVGSSGTPIKVLRAHEIHYPEKAYEITFFSGEKIIAGGEHLWSIEFSQRGANGNEILTKTMNTDSIYDRFAKRHDGRMKRKVYIPRARRIYTSGESTKFPLDPYILGLWLGDGFSYHATICVNMKEDSFIADYIKKWAVKEGYGFNLVQCKHAPIVSRCSITGGFWVKLKEMNLLKNKHIPEDYFHAPYEIRMELLRGLMDTDGTAYRRKCADGVRSCYEFSNKNKQVIQDVERLVAGVGAFPSVLTRKQSSAGFSGENNEISAIAFNHVDNPFKLPRKAAQWLPPKLRIDRQRILFVKPVEKRLMRCLSVDAGDMLFAVGKRFTLTRNTASGMSMLMAQANINLKTVMKNIDNCWIEPVVEAFYRWFTEIEPVMKLMPLKIVATGADSLMAREIKLENLIKTKQAMSSPQDAMFIDNIKLNKQLFRLLETEDVMKTDDEIKQVMQTMTELAKQPRDLREMIDVDRLYPYLMKSERAQILSQIGIQPDPNQPEGLLVELIELAKAARKGQPNQPTGPAPPVAGV